SLGATDVTGAAYSHLITATAPAIDWDQGNVQSLTLTSSPTLAFLNGHAGGVYKLIVRQDSTGGRMITWPTSVKWPGNTAPTLTASPNATDLMPFVHAGTSYLGSYPLPHGSAVALPPPLPSLPPPPGSIALDSADATMQENDVAISLSFPHTTSGSNR